MQRGWHGTVRVLASLLLGASCALSQYTISARPGAINYIEGSVTRDGEPIGSSLRNVFLGPNDLLATTDGKAEVLLTPGVFLRVGSNSQIRMISPSLVHTQFEVVSGEAMVEVAEIEKDNDIEIIDHGASVTLAKVGLYRFTADNPPTAGVLEGKAIVRVGEAKLDLGKNRQTVLASNLKAEKLDDKKQDELYAWSNVRSEYDSAASVHMARSVYDKGYSAWGSGYGYAFDGFGSPGWYWNVGFSSWAWLPGGAGAFYSPFGYGFYSPGIVSYAPVVYVPTNHGMWHGNHPPGKNGQVPVGVNPKAPPAVGGTAGSAWANHMARVQAARSMNSSGFTSVNGQTVTSFRDQGRAMGNAAEWGARRSGGEAGGNWAGHSAGAAGGNWSASHSGGGASPAMGASHAGGGGFSGGGGGGGHAGGGGGGGNRSSK